MELERNRDRDFFKRSATVLEVIIGGMTILSTVIAVTVSISTTQARQDERIKGLENNYRDINYELKNLNIKQTEILLELKDKQDRKN